MAQNYSYDGTQHVLETPQGKLHYHEAGSGTPLILLHGSGPGVTGWANFQGNLGLFAQHFRTFILDMPGYGGSDPVEGNPIQGAVDAVVRFMDAMGIEKANILGNSLGGMVGSFVAAYHPQRVIRFCTIGGIGQAIFSPFPGEGINLLVEFTENPTRENIVAWLRSMVYDQSMVTEELIQDRLARATTPEAIAWSKKLYSREAIKAIANPPPTAPRGWNHLPLIQCPTLVTWGRDDRVSPVDMSLLPMRLIPKCELHIFYNCGHWAMIERKAEFENVVLAFFRRDEK
jgi:2-hydroxy-6-oxonona-2,4-dienedioate hydrolase